VALANAILKNVNYRNDTEGREEDAEGIAERMGRQDDQNKGKDMGRKRRRNGKGMGWWRGSNRSI